jgi:hypothetical protein
LTFLSVLVLVGSFALAFDFDYERALTGTLAFGGG